MSDVMGREPAVDKQIHEYAIGDELFRHVVCGGTFRYIVQGIRQYEGETQLEVECQTCSHGWKCRLLIARNDYGKIHAVHMLNDDDEDTQRHWHGNDPGLHFWPTKEQAQREGWRKIVRDYDERISKAEAQLAGLRERRKEIAALIEDPQP